MGFGVFNWLRRMADKNMPMLLDDGMGSMPMEPDPLFDDTAALSIAPRPSKQIDLRIDKVRNRGCCRWESHQTICKIKY